MLICNEEHLYSRKDFKSYLHSRKVFILGFFLNGAKASIILQLLRKNAFIYEEDFSSFHRGDIFSFMKTRLFGPLKYVFALGRALV